MEPIVLGEVKNEIRDQYLDSTKAKQVLGWTPRYSLKEGLGETMTWYTDYLSR
jgi:CDP-glucose 4,6-dehydratase